MDINSINSAFDLERQIEKEQLKRQKENERDFAIQQTMVNTYNQNILLQNQLKETNEQVKLLEENNKTLKELYDSAIRDSENSKKSAKISNIISISAVIVSIIGLIISVLLSVLL